ncbi:MAG TPA: aspartyl protease family protein [Gemmataceae bacterium]|jgi:hypothetical protein|nr:aspartyl protease family protein [Gemmataceae bacterium]
MSQQLTFAISKDGLALDVQIGLPAPALQATLALGQPFLPVTTIRALIDTGADSSSVAPDVLTRLGLLSSGQVKMTTASGTVMVDRYAISPRIFGPVGATGGALVRPLWNVTSFSQPLPGVEALVGMDLIRQIVLKIDGPGGTFTLEF